MLRRLSIALFVVVSLADACFADRQFSREFLLEVKEGNIAGHSIVSKFGSGAVSTTLVPVAQGLVFQTPTSNTALEFVSSSVDDTSTGTGAREITYTGLTESGGVWSEVTNTLATNGTTAVALPDNLIRLNSWWVSQSGTYATQSAGSHAGTLTIRVSGAGATWSTIGITPFPFGQSQIGAYTIPSGKTGYLITKSIHAEGSKVVDMYFFQRAGANDIVAPYTGTMRIVQREVGVSGSSESTFRASKGPFAGPCDIGFMGVVASGTDTVSVEFEILLIDN